MEEPHAVMRRQAVLAPAAVMPTVAVATQSALSAEETVQEHSCSVVILAELAEIALAALDEVSGSAASPALSKLRQGVWQPACRGAEPAGTHQEQLCEEAERQWLATRCARQGLSNLRSTLLLLSWSNAAAWSR